MFTGHRKTTVYQLGLCLWLASLLPVAFATTDAGLTDVGVSDAGGSEAMLSGKQLMQRVYERHQQFPYIYEEQSLVMEDSNGDRDTRRAKRYTRVEPDGTVKFLLLFEYPEEIRGVAVLAERQPDGQSSRYVYLPALGETLTETIGGAGDANFLGTDFSVENLTGEDLSRYRYVRRDDREIDNVSFYLVDVFEKASEIDKPVRRHFIRQDNHYITLTHHYDRLGRISRVQSQHDLRPVAGEMWRADMILMVDKKEAHQSLIKVSRRVYSSDYVPEEVFTAAWLFEQYPYIEPELEEEEQDLLLIEEPVPLIQPEAVE